MGSFHGKTVPSCVLLLPSMGLRTLAWWVACLSLHDHPIFPWTGVYLIGGIGGTRLLAIRLPPCHLSLHWDRRGGRGTPPPAAYSRHVRLPSCPARHPGSRPLASPTARAYLSLFHTLCLPPPTVACCLPSVCGRWLFPAPRGHWWRSTGTLSGYGRLAPIKCINWHTRIEGRE